MAELARVWSGGEYLDREGIEVVADATGITIRAWYDGGIWIEPIGRLSWGEVADLRRGHARRHREVASAIAAAQEAIDTYRAALRGESGG